MPSYVKIAAASANQQNKNMEITNNLIKLNYLKFMQDKDEKISSLRKNLNISEGLIRQKDILIKKLQKEHFQEVCDLKFKNIKLTKQLEEAGKHKEKLQSNLYELQLKCQDNQAQIESSQLQVNRTQKDINVYRADSREEIDLEFTNLTGIVSPLAFRFRENLDINTIRKRKYISEDNFSEDEVETDKEIDEKNTYSRWTKKIAQQSNNFNLNSINQAKS